MLTYQPRLGKGGKMQVTGAVIREQGMDFAVVVVKPHVIAIP